jgi:hypothetical protein
MGAIGSLFFTHPPDGFIAGDGSLIAIRQGETLLVSPGKSSTFYKELWMKELGITKTAVWNTTQFRYGDCLFIDQSRRWFAPREIRKICHHYKIIVSNGPLRKFCSTPPRRTIIDNQQLRRQGSYIFWFLPTGCYYQSVRASLGDRLWSKK